MFISPAFQRWEIGPKLVPEPRRAAQAGKCGQDCPFMRLPWLDRSGASVM